MTRRRQWLLFFYHSTPSNNWSLFSSRLCLDIWHLCLNFSWILVVLIPIPLLLVFCVLSGLLSLQHIFIMSLFLRKTRWPCLKCRSSLGWSGNLRIMRMLRSKWVTWYWTSVTPEHKTPRYLGLWNSINTPKPWWL